MAQLDVDLALEPLHAYGRYFCFHVEQQALRSRDLMLCCARQALHKFLRDSASHQTDGPARPRSFRTLERLLPAYSGFGSTCPYESKLGHHLQGLLQAKGDMFRVPRRKADIQNTCRPSRGIAMESP